MVVKTADWIRLESCPVDIYDIQREAIKFNDIMRLCESFDDDEGILDNIRDLQKATLHFTQAKNLVRNLIKPEDNPYIGDKENKELYKWLVDSLGRADRRLAEFQADISERTENQALMKRAYSFIKVVSFHNFLIEAMQSLVYYPMKNSYIRWINTPLIMETKSEDGVSIKKVVKDKDLFVYFIFLEMFHAALSVGSLTREDINRPANQKGFVNTQPIGAPSQLPVNLRMEEIPLAISPQQITSHEPLDESALFGTDSGEEDYV